MMMHQCIAFSDCLLEYTSEKKAVCGCAWQHYLPSTRRSTTRAASDEESCGSSMSCSYQVSRLRKNDIFSQGTVSHLSKVLNCNQD